MRRIKVLRTMVSSLLSRLENKDKKTIAIELLQRLHFLKAKIRRIGHLKHSFREKLLKIVFPVLSPRIEPKVVLRPESVCTRFSDDFFKIDQNHVKIADFPIKTDFWHWATHKFRTDISGP